MPDNDVCWPKSGEIDILEMINGDGNAHGTYHWSTTACGADSDSGDQTKMPTDWGSAFHEYAVEYTTDYVAFFADETMYANVTHDDHNATFFDVPWYVILNTAVGGPWPGPPSADTQFPTYHHIDYVRVAQPTALAAAAAVDNNHRQQQPAHQNHHQYRHQD